jgi:hypothetical protein
MVVSARATCNCVLKHFLDIVDAMSRIAGANGEKCFYPHVPIIFVSP